eukprot:1966979-Alexandrium_andersonii.AAC.1
MPLVSFSLAFLKSVISLSWMLDAAVGDLVGLLALGRQEGIAVVVEVGDQVVVLAVEACHAADVRPARQ